jgi:hypothetical protein
LATFFALFKANIKELPAEFFVNHSMVMHHFAAKRIGYDKAKRHLKSFQGMLP